MKKVLLCKVLLFTIVAALLVSSCTIENIFPDKGLLDEKVAVLLPDASVIDRWATDKENLETIMYKYGFNTVFYTAPETEAGAALQVEQLKQVIEDGVQFIVLTAIDYKRINDSELLEQNPDVKVVCHDRIVLDNPYIDYISSADTKEIGRMQASYLLNQLHYSGASSMTVEFLQGPETDINAKDYYEGAMERLGKYIENGSLVVKSGKKEYSQVKADSWSIDDGKKAMQDRLGSYGKGQCPDLILAANDNLAQGAIEALIEAGIKNMPIITGQDNTLMAQENIKNHRQAMTIDKNLVDMAYNTALIINSLLCESPVLSNYSVNAGAISIPAFYSRNTLLTIDSY